MKITVKYLNHNEEIIDDIEINDVVCIKIAGEMLNISKDNNEIVIGEYHGKD